MESGARRAFADWSNETTRSDHWHDDNARGDISHGGNTLRIVAIPLADGGEGTVEAFVRGAGATLHRATVRGPMSTHVQAQWAVLPDGAAVLEMAQASGLTLVPPRERDATRASSFGTGELIRAALDAGCRKIILGIGGSASTDGGAGALQALGARFLNVKGHELAPGGLALRDLSEIDTSALDARLARCELEVLCDVSNPLCGPRGAARIYGPQKGASSDEVALLDDALHRYARCMSTHVARDWSAEAGAGAAGGIGFGLLSLANARLVPGIEAILGATNFERQLESVDLVLTGEGAIDAQTLNGKTVLGIARAARNAKKGCGVPVVAFGGMVKLSGAQLHRAGISAAFAICDAPMPLAQSIARGEELLANATEHALRLWLCGRARA